MPGPESEGADKQSQPLAAEICVAGDDEWFQGRIVDLRTRQQTGILGERTAAPESFHECCFAPDERPLFYKITVVDYAQQREWVLPNVMRVGGDNVELRTEDDSFRFVTSSFLVDAPAAARASRVFASMLAHGACDVLVCKGSVLSMPDPPPA